MEDQRSQVRIWSDRIHRILGAITAIAVVWIFTQAHTADKNQAVFVKTLENINITLTQHNTRLSVLETIRVEIAQSHYTKPEVESLVDRTVRPLQRDINRLEDSMSSKLEKIYDEVKKK